VDGWLEIIAARLPGGPEGSAKPAGTVKAPVMVGIDGRSGSGKSTLAVQLRRLVTERFAVTSRLVRMDHIYPGWDGLEAGSATLAQEVLPQLARGDAGSYRRWDWLHHRYSGRTVVVQPAAYVIVEGVGSCARACAPYLTLQVWLDAPEPVRFGRAMARDGDTYRPHWHRWAEAEHRHFVAERTSERADLHFTTT
jgi:uridine kinase